MRPTMRKFVPIWAFQFVIGIFVVLIAIAIGVALLGPVIRGPTAFFDELGKTISRVAPQPQPDLRTDEQVKAVIRAMPEGKLRVGTIVEEQNRVVFTITADRSAVKAAVRPGERQALRAERDLLRNAEAILRHARQAYEALYEGEAASLARLGEAIRSFRELIDALQRAIDDLKRKFFGP